MIDPSSLRRRAPAIDRSSDRVVAVVAIVVAVGFLVAALATILLPAVDRRGVWLPLHLALAGGATTAIAGVMPFFAAAFAAAPPSDARLRFAAVGAVAIGAVGASFGVVATSVLAAGVGGALFLLGVVLTGVATIRPLGRALGPSRGLVSRGYVVALGEVASGALLATLYAAGWGPVVGAWATLKPAHAWLNLVGFVSLVVATTLLHFFPTVIGARIVVRRSARLTVMGLAFGAPLVALGLAVGSDAIARAGALVTAVGAASIAVNAARTWPTRARWTTDPGWHRHAMGSLIAAIAWFEAGMAIAISRVLAFGSGPGAWAIEAVGGPLVAGWVGLAILGSASHLLPAVGPGDPAAHARQRRLLGRFAGPRLAIANAGIAGLAIGWPLHQEAVAAAGACLVAIGLGSTAALLAAALRVGFGPAQPRPAPSGRPPAASHPDAAPTGLHAVSASPAGIELAWDAVSGDASLFGYEVLRGDSAGGPFAQIGALSSTAFTDAAVDEGATYWYAVRSVDTSFNRSASSSTISATAELRTVTLVFTVSVPAGTDGAARDVNIAGFIDRLDGNHPEWDPSGTSLTRVDATHWTITFTGREATQLEYKYALDSWDYVEKDGACGEVANRLLTLSYGATGTQTVKDVVENWRNVAPCGN